MNLFGSRKPQPKTPLSVPDQYAQRYVAATEHIEIYRGGIIVCEVIGGLIGVLAIIQDSARLAVIAGAWLVGAWYCAHRRNWWTGTAVLIKEDAAEWEANRLAQLEEANRP